MTITAAEVLTHHAIIAKVGDNPVFFATFVNALLAQVPDGEPVVIMPDGTLARLAEYWPEDSGRKLKLYRLVPLTGEP